MRGPVQEFVDACTTEYRLEKRIVGDQSENGAYRSKNDDMSCAVEPAVLPKDQGKGDKTQCHQKQGRTQGIFFMIVIQRAFRKESRYRPVHKKYGQQRQRDCDKQSNQCVACKKHSVIGLSYR